jgi:glycolate oxidase FAD binding subunit
MTAIDDFAERIRAASAARTPLVIRAGGTKDFYGNATTGDVLDPRVHRGIVAYEPTELVATVRAGTPLAELEATLDERGQLLSFEPPHFAPGATVGGCVAAGLAGPRRASYGPLTGAVRDLVLGATLMNGRGEVLRFGGTVMKNVAGYDVARALAGSLGTLGLLLEVSLKVLPKPAAEATLRLALDESSALRAMNEWGGLPLPISATAWRDGTLTVRLSGARAAVDAARARLGGDVLDAADAGAYWRGVRDHTDAFFAGTTPLWRLSLPSTAPALALQDDHAGAQLSAQSSAQLSAQLIEWGGAQRWLRTGADAGVVRARAEALGGHATLFRTTGERVGMFHPLAPALATIHQRLKSEFDPGGIFNRGRMYSQV